MTIIKWHPFRDIEKFLEEDFPFLPMPTMPKLGWDLAVDVYEEKGNVVAEMHLPGINIEKLDVAVEDNYLRISGAREEEKELKEKNYYSKEIQRGSFERTVRLPAQVLTDKAEANYKDGILKISIPKHEEAKSQKIKVTID